MKLAINECYGGFRLSDEATNLLKEKTMAIEGEFDEWMVRPRTYAPLIETIEELGDAASDECSHIVIREIPDDATDWMIESEDGWESIIYVLDGRIKMLL